MYNSNIQSQARRDILNYYDKNDHLIISKIFVSGCII